jgi:histidine kinase
MLGHPISISRRSRTLMVKYIVLRIWLSRRRVQSLSKLPAISDPRNMLVMKLLLDLSISLYMSSPQLYIPLVFKIFDFTLKFGNSPATFLGLAVYGSLCAKFEAYELGNQLGEMALQGYEKFGQADSGAKLLLFYGAGIGFWKHHISFSIKCLRRGLERAAEIGDLNFAMYYIQAILHFHLAGGAPLEEVEAECKKHYDLMAQTPDEAGTRLVTSLRQTVKCLQGKTKSCVSLDDDAFSEADHMNRLEHGDVQSVIMRHYLLRLQLLFIMGDYEGALEIAQKTARLSIYNAGTFIVTEYYFYRCLSMLALYQQSSLPKQRHYKKKIRRYIAKFTKMAAHCPPNFEHKRLILIGEKAHVDGKFEQALCRFSEAVTSARENGFIHMSAIANELSANSALKKGHPVLAKMFLEQAHADYLKWGADGKCKWLIGRYPEFLRDKAASDTLPAMRPIDYATVVNSLQAISTEIVLDRLLKRLMKIVVENAGAQRVLFMLKEGDQLDVKASGGTSGPIRITHQPMPVEKRSDLLLSGIHFVINTLQSIVIDDAVKDSAYRNDPYVVQHKPKSIFCLPVLRQNDLIAIVYLENSLAAGVFTPDRIEILQLIASQAAISIENARLYESLRQKERDLIDLSENLRSLSSELLLTEERERRRIAVDLHDRIGHALANIKMQLGDLKEDLNQPQGLPKMRRIAELVDQSIQDTQSLTFDLSPPVLYDLGLEAALEWLVDQMQEQHRISMVFEDDQQPKPLNESIRILAFQATRELLFNIVKHAHAHHAWVSIKRDEEWVHIEIKDDGVGLHASSQSRPTNRKTGGFGLFSIQERLKHFGGRLEMASEPGKGTQVTLIAPMQLH